MVEWITTKESRKRRLYQHIFLSGKGQSTSGDCGNWDASISASSLFQSPRQRYRIPASNNQHTVEDALSKYFATLTYDLMKCTVIRTTSIHFHVGSVDGYSLDRDGFYSGSSGMGLRSPRFDSRVWSHRLVIASPFKQDANVKSFNGSGKH